MSKIPALLLLVACATSKPEKVDWVAVDAAMREARWRTDRCVEPNSAKCDALWLVKEEIQAIIDVARARFEQEHKAEVERLTTP